MTRLPLITLSTFLAFAVPFNSTNAQTQIDMQDRACAEFKKADAELNKTYKKIMNEYKKDKVFIEKLKKAQKAWLTYRDAHIDSIYPVEDKASEYGSVYGMCYCTAKKELTEQRTKMLKQWVDGVMEGDVCSGSQKFNDSSATPALSENVKALEKAVKAWAEESKAPSYRHAFADLNDDGIDDAVVLITDNQYCGSGGCSFVIFQGVGGGFKVVSSSTITREPILLLPEKKKGWHTLSVLVAGGGAKPGQVMMRFDGRNYPSNPSMEPKANRSDLKGAKTLISESN